MVSESPIGKDDFQFPILRMAADEETQDLETKAGKVTWALAEFEVALPVDAAQKVNDLKQRVAKELATIIREIGTFKTL